VSAQNPNVKSGELTIIFIDASKENPRGVEPQANKDGSQRWRDNGGDHNAPPQSGRVLVDIRVIAGENHDGGEFVVVNILFARFRGLESVVIAAVVVFVVDAES